MAKFYSLMKTLTLLCALSSFMFLQSCEKDEVLESVSTAATTQYASGSCLQVCLVAGQNTKAGTVDVGTTPEGDLLVTFKVNQPNVYLSEVHVDIFKDLEQFTNEKKVSNGGAIPGKFAYKNTWKSGDKTSTYTLKILKSYIESKKLTTNCLFIATHAALSNGETAWGGLCEETAQGASLYKAKQFPGKNWSVYFDFCLDACNTDIDFTYAWEDMKFGENDGDYNDLVIQANVMRSASALTLDFLANARGAHYDHEFKIKLLKAGITKIDGAASYKTEGNYYIITVFESTQKALPGNQYGFANTQEGTSCTPFAKKRVVLSTDNSFSYNSSKPYEPFITVYQSGQVGSGEAYNLFVYEISGMTSGTWFKGGKEYPNGIMIPRDWRWPDEGVMITSAYPKFTSLTDGFTANWAEFLTNPSYTYDGSCIMQ